MPITERPSLPGAQIADHAVAANRTLRPSNQPGSGAPAGKRRYKTEIASVSPPSARRTFEGHDSCFFGVSLENSHFERAKLASMVTWISRRFARSTILIGDGIHRITLESTRSLSELEASAEALRIGREFLRDNRDVFEHVSNRTELTFLLCSEVQQWLEYRELHEEIRRYFDKDEGFKASVESFGSRYHRRRAEGLTEAELAYRIQRSCDYFLEEFAIFGCLWRRGLSIMVYPGSFSTLSEIAAGEHSGAPQELKELIVVSLDLKGRGNE